MKKLMGILCIWLLIASCNDEDPGPRQQDFRSYTVFEFDRLDVGDAIVLTVKQGLQYSVDAEGDRRNLDDLQVYKSGSSLMVRFNSSRQRQYTTYVNIVMPALNGVSLSGAVNAKISGFKSQTRFDATLSGASTAQVGVESEEVYMNLSGASELLLTGLGQKIDGNISGASKLGAFDFPAATGRLIVSGASNGKVTVSQTLDVNASGASMVIYRGSPQLKVTSTGSSIVRQD